MTGRTWDVIVVGGGAAGAVVAARASERPDLDVLLLEAGPDYESASRVPDDLINGHLNSVVDHDWDLQYTAVPDGRPVHFPRGRVTGGSTAVNTTIALRAEGIAVPDRLDREEAEEAVRTLIRWIGDDPPAHGIRAKRGMVC